MRRYAIVIDSDGLPNVAQNSDGEWVRYDEAARAFRVMQETDLETARTCATLLEREDALRWRIKALEAEVDSYRTVPDTLAACVECDVAQLFNDAQAAWPEKRAWLDEAYARFERWLRQRKENDR